MLFCGGYGCLLKAFWGIWVDVFVFGGLGWFVVRGFHELSLFSLVSRPLLVISLTLAGVFLVGGVLLVCGRFLASKVLVLKTLVGALAV